MTGLSKKKQDDAVFEVVDTEGVSAEEALLLLNGQIFIPPPAVEPEE